MLKSRRGFVAVINDRLPGGEGEITFSLRGSNRAIERLERHCDRPAQAAPPPPARTQTAVAETSRWRYTEEGRNAYAESCGQFGRREICATVYCRRGRGVEFGLSGLNEENDRPRAGRLTLNRSRDVTFTLERGPEGRGDRIWRADHPNPERFVERLKRADLLEIDVERRRRPLVFTLRGSSRAISNVEARCDEVADRRADRVQTQRPRRIRTRYEEEAFGRWGVDRFSCRGGGWVFDQGALATPDGARCGRLELFEVARGPLAGGVGVRGLQCRGGARPLLGETREFELLRQGDRLVMRTIEERTIRAGNLTIQLGAQEQIRELIRCRR